jgi:hypothetical protein
MDEPVPEPKAAGNDEITTVNLRAKTNPHSRNGALE